MEKRNEGEIVGKSERREWKEGGRVKGRVGRETESESEGLEGGQRDR